MLFALHISAGKALFRQLLEAERRVMLGLLKYAPGKDPSNALSDMSNSARGASVGTIGAAPEK